MAFVVADRVKETSTSTGTGTITLAGAVTGFQSFAAVGNGNTTYYCIASQSANEWEVGLGTYTSSGTTLARTTVLSSSNGGSLVNFSAGTKDVFVTYPAGYSVYSDGTRASGTWGINISGNAATVSSIGTTQVTTLYSPNGTTVVDPGTAAAMPAQGQSFIHTLGTGPGGNDGHLLAMSWASTTSIYGAQLWIDTDPTNTMSIRSRSAGGVWNSWADVITSWSDNQTKSGYFQSNSSLRAPVFYDSNDTGYYIDPASTSNSALRMRGGALFGPNPTWGAYLYVGTDGTPGTSYGSVCVTNGNLHIDAVDGYALYLNNYSTNSYTIAAQSIRSPIFYDLNNTGYYVDPASTSNLNVINSVTQTVTPNTSGVGTGLTVVNGDITTYRSGGTTGVIYLSNSGTKYLYWDGTNYNMPGGNLYVNGTQVVLNSGTWSINVTGSAGSASTATNATQLGGYAANTYVGKFGNTYYQADTWIQCNGIGGLYWAAYNAAEINANTTSSYGAVAIVGSRNTWRGIHFQGGGNTPHLMFDGSANGGIYYESTGRWASYYNYSNNCWGYGTSTTNSAYNIYCPTGVYSGGRVDGTIFYDSNNTAYYADPASTSNFNALNVGGYAVLTYAGATTWNVFYFGSNKGASSYVGTSNTYGLEAYSSDGGAAAMSFHRGGYYAINMGLDPDNVMRIGGWSAPANLWQLDMSGNNYLSGSSRAPIFYDSNNTAYYADPASTSVFNALTVGGASVITTSNISSYASSAGAGGAMLLNTQTISANYTLSGNNAVSSGPITINTGVTVTISTGCNWSIV